MSFAIFRQVGAEDLNKLAEQHVQHEYLPHFNPASSQQLTILNSLTEEDRVILKSATTKLSTYTTIGSILGMGLTTALAFRIRQNRMKMFEAFKTAKKPTHVKFADGREGESILQYRFCMKIVV
jgi:hypothetical protein